MCTTDCRSQGPSEPHLVGEQDLLYGDGLGGYGGASFGDVTGSLLWSVSLYYASYVPPCRRASCLGVVAGGWLHDYLTVELGGAGRWALCVVLLQAASAVAFVPGAHRHRPPV